MTIALGLWPMLGQGKGKTCKEQAKARKEAQTHLGEWKGNVPKLLKQTHTLGVGGPKVSQIFATRMQGVNLVQGYKHNNKNHMQYNHYFGFHVFGSKLLPI